MSAKTVNNARREPPGSSWQPLNSPRAIALAAALICCPGVATELKADEGPLPRHTVPDVHVSGLLDQTSFDFVGRQNPGGPYPDNARNWADLYGYQYDGTDPLLVGKEYAYVAAGGLARTAAFESQFQGGVAIFDVTNTANPILAGTYLPACTAPDGQCDFLFRDVEIHDGIAYFSSQGTDANDSGVFVVDVRADPVNPPTLRHLNSSVTNGPLQGIDKVHEIGVDFISTDEAYLYAANARANGTVSVYDVSDPRNPGSISLLTNIVNTASDGISALSTHSVFAQDGIAYLAGSAGETMNIYDVSDIANGNFNWLGVFPGGGGQTHSGWPDTYVNGQGELRDVLYVTHERNGVDLRVFDVTDVLSGADPGGAFEIPGSRITNTFLQQNQGTGSIKNVHNVFLVGDILFTTWTIAGMVVFDVSDPTQPQVIDTFDTSFLQSNSNFVGSFGVNPTLGFDRVLVSDRSTGLWVVDITALVPEPEPPLGDINGDGIVDAGDYTEWANAFGQMGPNLPADLNGNGIVDAGDYTLWANNFGATSSAPAPGFSSAAVPEPSTFVLLAIALASLVVFRRRLSVARSA